MQKLNSQGFGTLAVLALVIVVAALGGGGYYVWHKNHSSKPTIASRANTSTTSVSQSATWKTYANSEADLTFQYPSTWTSKVDSTTHYNDGSLGGVTGTVTSPNGNVMTWVYQVAGGKGGDCTPNVGDVPFADGDQCASKTTLSVEKLPAVSKPSSTPSRDLFEDGLYITHTKYRASNPNATITYQTCLDPYRSDEPQPTVGVSMGLLFPCQYWSTGFNAQFGVHDESGFNAPDAKTAEQIMKTFNYL